MAQKIVYNYPDLSSTAAKIKEIAGEFTAAGNKLLTDIDAQTSEWEGASKDKFKSLIEGNVKKYVTVELPKAVQEFANVLEQDAKSMQQADADVANGINV